MFRRFGREIRLRKDDGWYSPIFRSYLKTQIVTFIKLTCRTNINIIDTNRQWVLPILGTNIRYDSITKKCTIFELATFINLYMKK